MLFFQLRSSRVWYKELVLGNICPAYCCPSSGTRHGTTLNCNGKGSSKHSVDFLQSCCPSFGIIRRMLQARNEGTYSPIIQWNENHIGKQLRYSRNLGSCVLYSENHREASQSQFQLFVLKAYDGMEQIRVFNNFSGILALDCRPVGTLTQLGETSMWQTTWNSIGDFTKIKGNTTERKIFCWNIPQ